MTDPRHVALHLVRHPVRDYAWGSVTAIPELLGYDANGEPQAEVWLGAHPSAPSELVDDGARLDDHLARHPHLSDPAGHLPFLMKVLAAARPLSLQVHPNRLQAQEGYAREDAAGISLDDPRRNYKDSQHKPEIIVAVSEFQALCGFRAPGESAQALRELLGEAADEGVAAQLLGSLEDPDQEAALRSAYALILSGRPEIRTLVERVVAAARVGEGQLADTVRLLADHYPDDPGILGAALLNRVDLAPGEALFLDAGNVHAYLRGLGIESMAPSDNVLRGGLTPKRVDVPELLRIVRFHPIVPRLVQPAVSERDHVRLTSYLPPVVEFAVHALVAEGGPRVLDELTGPAMLIVTAGVLEVSTGAERLELCRGDSAFAAAGYRLRVRALGGRAEAFLTTPGRAEPPDAG